MATRKSRTGDGAAHAAPSTLSVTEQVPFARAAAVKLLAVKERTRSDLRARLRRKGFHPLAVEEALDVLARAGLQSDGRYAEQYAAEAGAKGKAGRLIKAELRRRGVDEEGSAAAAAIPPEVEYERALALARVRVGRMRGLAPEVRARRLLGLLARRGYDADVCRRVVGAAVASTDQEDV